VALKRVETANAAALLEPSLSGYVNAAQVYPWTEGSIFRLYAAPGLVSDVALQPGEELISVAAGDTVRWVIGDTASGSGAAKRTHILVKPSSVGLHTNLVITTDRRVYFVQLESSSGPTMAAISWSYPQDELLAIRRIQTAAVAAAPVASGVAVDSLNFNYVILGDQPAWRPVRAFDDGAQVFIEFPPSLVTGEAPPLFVIGSSGRAELVNYRQRGHYYVVDRLFSAAELRLGQKRQQVVRIVRGDTSRVRGGGGS
jgi:type IV secretion system protein VirB9